MKRATLAITVLALAASGLGIAQRTPAQTQASSQSGSKVYVAFRMENWQAKHIHDAAAAKKHADTLKMLGCEVKTNDHNGHTDVQCRTVFWKSLALDSRDQADQWVKWLKQSGFDTIFGQRVANQPASSQPASGQTPAGQPHREIVKYRLVDWHSQHIHDATELNQLLALYRGLGCTVEVSKHGNHSDVRARCPEWMEIELPSHDAAHKWQDFLKKGGFETRHEH